MLTNPALCSFFMDSVKLIGFPCVHLLVTPCIYVKGAIPIVWFWVYKVEKAAFGQLFLFDTFIGYMQQPLIFTAKLGWGSRITTAAVFVILSAVAFAMISAVADESPISKAVMYIVAVIVFPLPLALAYLYSPVHYELTEEALIIRRRLASVVVRISDVTSIDFLNPSFLQDMSRSGGNGGVFGYYGDFTAGRDRYRLYLTQSRNIVLIITTAGEKLVISPDDRHIVTLLRSRIQELS
jgi:hypothetical protein